MKVYLDQSIIIAWLQFKSEGIPHNDYIKKAKKADIRQKEDLEAFAKIFNMHSVTFLYSRINELEFSSDRKPLFDDFVSSDNFVKVPTVGNRICMDRELPKDNILVIGEVQSYFASHIRKFGSKVIKGRDDFIKYMHKKFFDPIHIDSAIYAGADIFLTLDYRLLNSIDNHLDFRTFLASKISLFTPSELIRQYG